MKKITVYQILLGIATVVIIILIIWPFMRKTKTAEVPPVEITTTTSNGEWRKITPEGITSNTFSLINSQWLALAAGGEGDMNAMTISWGGFGILWGKPVVTVYVSTDRYTYGFMERNDYFTVTAFPEQYRDRLVYIGSHSGRDGDKIKDAGLAVEYTDLGNPTFTDGNLMIECRKIYSQQFDPSRFNEDTKAIYSKGMGVHHLYIGEIVNVWTK